MPSIYPTLKHSDRKFIRTEKARIRVQFSDMAKQKEMIGELYTRLLPKDKGDAKKEEPKKVEVKKEAKKVKPKK